jgi:hypothetical protein
MLDDKKVYDRLPTKKEGKDGDERMLQYKGNFYIAVKIRGKWRFFKETSIGDM